MISSHYKVTTILTTYNVESFIEEAINSVLNQTFPCSEIIVIDDGSTDCTLEILDSFKNNSIVKVYKRNHTSEIAKNLNFGIKKANGDLIAIMGADDVWLANKLEEQIKYIDEFDAICSNGYVIDKVGLIKSDYCVVKPGHNFTIDIYQMLRKNLVIASSVLAKRSTLLACELFDELLMNRAEDYSLWLKITENKLFYYVNSPLVKYRIHDQNLSFKSLENRTELILTTIEIKKRYIKLDDKLISKAVYLGLHSLYFQLSKTYFDFGKYSLASKYARLMLYYSCKTRSRMFVKYFVLYLMIKFKLTIDRGRKNYG